MIIYNNLSNIYRYHKQGQQQHEERYQQCLERLHSTIILAVDHNKRQHHCYHHHHVQQSINIDIVFEYCNDDDDNDDESEGEGEEEEEFVYDSLSMSHSFMVTGLININEGFLQNLSRITLQQRECFPNAA